MMGARPLPSFLLLMLVALLSTGCASRMAQARRDAPTVLGVKINGNRSFAGGAIRAGLAQQKTSVLHFIPPFTFFQPRYYLDDTAWQDDRTRIANFYAVRGYFDARVISSQVVPGRQRRPDGGPRFVSVVHTVAEGAPSLIRELVVAVDPGVGQLVVAGAAQGRRGGARAEMGEAVIQPLLESALPVKTGDRFEVSEVEGAERVLRQTLHDRGHATASVVTRIDAYPEDRAVDVTFDVLPGPIAAFGEVKIRGLASVQERYVRRHVTIISGESWDGSKVRSIQRTIYGMGVFSLVTVTPDLSGEHGRDAEGRVIVPVDIAVRERKPRSFEYSPGLAWDIQGFTLQPLDVTLKHINLGGRLIQAELSLTGGYRYLSATDHFPTAGAGVDLVWPDFPARKFSLHGGTEVELGLEKGYKYWTPSAKVGLGWAPIKGLKIDVSYTLAYFDLFAARIGPEPVVPSQCPEVGKLPGDCTPPSDALAPEFRDNYLLSSFRQSVVLDLRDNPLAANKGFFARLSVDEAFPFGRVADGSLLGFRYIKLSGGVRGFIPVIPQRFVVALRLSGTHLATWGGEHELPINERVYLGGDGSVRGFKSRYLGPRGLEASCVTGDCIVPLGARSGVSASAELRGRLFGGLWLAAFTDLGRSWGDGSTDTIERSTELQALELALYGKDGVQISVGGGIRYDLSIGRVRIDFATRIRKWPEAFPEIKERFPWNIHFNLGESF